MSAFLWCVLYPCDLAYLSIYSRQSVCFKNLRNVCVQFYNSVWVPLFTEECLSAFGVILPNSDPLLLLLSLFTLDSLLLYGIKQ